MIIITTIIICKVHRILCIAVSPCNYSSMILFLIQTNNFGFTAIKTCERFIEIIRLILCEISGWGINESFYWLSQIPYATCICFTPIFEEHFSVFKEVLSGLKVLQQILNLHKVLTYKLLIFTNLVHVINTKQNLLLHSQ